MPFQPSEPNASVNQYVCASGSCGSVWCRTLREPDSRPYRTDQRRVGYDVLDAVERVAGGGTLRDRVLFGDALPLGGGEQREEASQERVELPR